MEYPVITVTLNPALDVTVWADDVDFEEPVKAKSETVYAGGKAINVSRVLTSLGVANKSVGIACENNFLTLRQLLEADGVDYAFVNPPGSIRENLTLCLGDGRVLKVNRRGEDVPPTVYREVKALIEQFLSPGSIVAFSGGMPPNCTGEIYADLVLGFCRAGRRIALDNDIFPLETVRKIHPLVYKPNLLEFKKLVGCKNLTRRELVAKVREAADCCDNLLLSMGEDGALFCSEGELYHLTVPQVEVKSTIGAGDTTLASFLASYLEGRDPVDCARCAVAGGTASVALDGTAAITREQLEEIRCKITAEKI